MAYQVVQDNFYKQQINLPFGVTSFVDYGIRYNPKTGEYQLRQKQPDILGGYDALGGATLYQDGSWSSDAIQDSKLFTNNDPNKPTQLAIDLSKQIREATHAAFKAIGGNAGGHKIHPTLKTSQHDAQPGVENNFPGQKPPIDPNTPIIGGLVNPPGQNQPITPPTAPIKASTKTTSNALQYGSLQYPSNIFKNQQDILHIQQIVLEPLNVEEVFADPEKALNGALKPLGGRATKINGNVFLPMPNNAADSNATAWGSDQMNNLTAALVSKAYESPGSTLGAAIIGAAGQAVGLGNVAQAAQLVDLLRQIGGTGALDPNLERQFNAILTSAAMKQAGFDIPPEQILAKSGVVPNSNLELLFNNVSLREFTFSYRMSPRSKEEAIEVRKIIHFFKRGMAAKRGNQQKTGNAGTFLNAPNIFDLKYITSDGKPIDGVNKFKRCALTNFAVNYAPEGQWSAYEEGQPVSYNIGMSFTEIEPVYEQDYEDYDLDVIGY